MPNERDVRIDFFRGLALIFIFWDHVPNNPLAYLTVRNFGFSDAAEIFVFLAGYAAVLAYGRIAQRDGFVVACVRILRRVWVLYVVHIFLLTLLMGIVFVANNHVETRDMIQEMGLGYFVRNPQMALADGLLLRFKPNLTDPLPLYILLLLALPLILPWLLRRTACIVGLSIALYLMVPMFGWNLPAYEGGVWYFNPVAWQLLFVLGGVCAVRGQRPIVGQPRALHSSFIHHGGGLSAAERVNCSFVAVASCSGSIDAQNDSQCSVPHQQDRSIAPAPAALPGLGLLRRKTAARPCRMDEQLACTTNIAHGPLFARSFLSWCIARAVSRHGQCIGWGHMVNTGMHGVGRVGIDGVAGGLARVEQAVGYVGSGGCGLEGWFVTQTDH